MSKSVKINGVTYPDVPKVSIPLSEGEGNADFFESSTATAGAANILNGKTAFVTGGEVTGTMPDNTGAKGTISKKADTYTIAKGYHDGTGTVAIHADEQAKIVEGNIRSGVTILGVAGSSSVVETKDATAVAGGILKGQTAYVKGTKVTGTLTLVQITQDATTKALTIA